MRVRVCMCACVVQRQCRFSVYRQHIPWTEGVCLLPSLQVGKKNRVVGATLMNQDSSRSHSIFTITIEATERFNSADAGMKEHGKVYSVLWLPLASWPCILLDY